MCTCTTDETDTCTSEIIAWRARRIGIVAEFQTCAKPTRSLFVCDFSVVFFTIILIHSRSFQCRMWSGVSARHFVLERVALLHSERERREREGESMLQLHPHQTTHPHGEVSSWRQACDAIKASTLKMKKWWLHFTRSPSPSTTHPYCKSFECTTLESILDSLSFHKQWHGEVTRSTFFQGDSRARGKTSHLFELLFFYCIVLFPLDSRTSSSYKETRE